MTILEVNISISVSLPIIYFLICWKSENTTNAYESSSQSLGTMQFHVAPMQGYTNSQTRKMFHLLSPSAIKWTEMEKLDDIFPRTESVDFLLDALEKRLGPPEKFFDAKNTDYSKSNLVLQVGTNDPDRLRTCVEHAVGRYNIKEFNLNCGCPAIESGGAPTYGASLMKDAELTGQLVAAARKGMEKIQGQSGQSPGVSVKCRIGVFESYEDMRPLVEGDYEYLRKYISTVHKNGGNHVILHARPAILSGLSPVKNRIVPTLDYGFVQKIAAEFGGKVDITLNGGITTLSQLRSFQEESVSNDGTVSSYMAGRWCLRRPLDLIEIETMLKGGECQSIAKGTSSVSLIQNAIEQYVDDAVSIGGSSSLLLHKPTIADLCLPLFLITEQLKDDYDYEEDLQNSSSQPVLTYDDVEALYDVLSDGIAQIEAFVSRGEKKTRHQSMNFKRLSSSFKSLVGKKVANKWKRNRAEL